MSAIKIFPFQLILIEAADALHVAHDTLVGSAEAKLANVLVRDQAVEVGLPHAKQVGLFAVGGGYAEAVILETARKMVREGTPRNTLIKVSMKKGVMHCGGEIEVFLWGISKGFTIAT